MEPMDYVVLRIEGDYATLQRIGANDSKFIARALLPEDADEGDRLHYELFEYTLTEKRR